MTTALQFSRREIAPAGPHVWFRETQGKFASLEREFSEWTAEIQSNEELFKKHIYGNDKPTQLDFRQHRASLSVTIAWGETLALKFLEAEGQSVDRYVELIDEKIVALRSVLHEWHGPIEGDAKLPESLHNKWKEAQEGRGLEDLDALLGD
jgi:hypothetical protein